MTFLLGLVAGLIIGWVVEWIIDWQFWRSEADETLDAERQLREELRQAQDEIAALQQQMAQESQPLSDDSANDHADDPADDLDEIDGIGPVFAHRLRQAGIVTFADLAVVTPDALRSAIGAEDWQSANTEAWVAEAQSRINQPSRGE